MMWQMWTAFGIALGLIVSVAFQNTDFLGENSQWRWMMASTSIPPLIVMIQVRPSHGVLERLFSGL
jgi:membrane protein YdbS with pleckstrin-like domain